MVAATLLVSLSAEDGLFPLPTPAAVTAGVVLAVVLTVLPVGVVLTVPAAFFRLSVEELREPRRDLVAAA